VKIFCYDNYAKNESRVVIFSSDLNFIFLENSKLLICDGTFFNCPPEFGQLYTIQGLIRGKFYSLVYCLIERSEI
jgi:hypothetical protein